MTRDLAAISQEVVDLIVEAEPMVVGYEVNPVFGTVRFLFPRTGPGVWVLAVDETRLYREDRAGHLAELATFLVKQWRKKEKTL